MLSNIQEAPDEATMTRSIELLKWQNSITNGGVFIRNWTVGWVTGAAPYASLGWCSTFVRYV